MGRIGTGVGSLRCSRDPTKVESEFYSEDAKQPLQGIEVAIHYAFFERNDSVLGNRD